MMLHQQLNVTAVAAPNVFSKLTNDLIPTGASGRTPPTSPISPFLSSSLLHERETVRFIHRLDEKQSI